MSAPPSRPALPEASREALMKAEKSDLVDIVVLALEAQKSALEISKNLNDLLAIEREKNKDLEDKLASQEAEIITLRNRPT